MKKTPLRKVSKKQAIKNKIWREITLLKWGKQNHYCSWCGRYVDNPDGHHIIRRSRGRIDTEDNCYIVHRICHDFIGLNNIDVSVYKNKGEWLSRT